MVFTHIEVEQFLSPGWIVLREGFPGAVAEAGRKFIWERIGRSWENCFTAGQPMIHLRENFGGEPFDRVMNPRLRGALDQLIGAKRWRFDEAYGWWPVLLPGFPGPGGWHIDEPVRIASPTRKKGS